MAELGLLNPSLVDVLSRTDPDGKISQIIEIAEQSNPILQDAVFTQCNDGTTHQHTIRNGYPEPVERKFNEFVASTKSETSIIRDIPVQFEAFPWVDKALADIRGNAAAWRASEQVAVSMGFASRIARNVVYGSDEVGSTFIGHEERYSDFAAPSGRNLFNGGGVGSDNTSILAITWGPRGSQMIYPEGSAAGYTHKDLDEQVRQNGNSSMMVYMDHNKWDTALTQGDWRSGGRIANIDVSALTKDAASGADLLDLMIDLEESLDTSAAIGIDMTSGELVRGKTVFYVSRTVAKFFRKQALSKSNNTLRYEEVAGKRCTMWGDYEVKRLDAISDAEAAVAFS
jgi:hypothetical protein